MNILLADTTPLYRDIFQHALGNHRGLKITLVSSGSEVLQAVAREHFHFIVLSWQLKDGNGIDVARRLRESGVVPHEPITVLTASASAEMAQQASLAGVTEIFRKQDIGELITFMRHFLAVHNPVPCRVIYVEDARDQRQVLAAQLAAWGMEVDAFASADEAWEAIPAKEYDLAICDIVLSGRMSGSRFINRIRRQPAPLGRLPILAATAFDHPSRRIELFHLGVDDYIVKPVIPMELRARVLNLLARKRAADLNSKLLAAADLGVTVINEDGVISSMDDNACAMFGADADAVAGTPVSALLPGESEQAAAELVAALRSGRFQRTPVTARRRDGSRFAAELTALEIDGSEGRRCFALLSKDVSRESELHQKLVEAKEGAEQMGRIKADFLANMSHEIRTPLNAIVGMTHLMRRSGVSPELEPRTAKIESAARHLAAIIDDVLDFSKIDSGKLTLERLPIAVGSIAANVASMLSERAEEKGIRLEVLNDPLPGDLLGDATRLTQALLNLATNAIKFTDRGSVSLRTRLREQTSGDALIRFEVIDTGIGLSAEQIPLLFQAFRQADSTTTRRYGGTGLGLAITRELARLMGGDAGVTSTPSVGSSFWFEVRLARHGGAPEPDRLMVPASNAERRLRAQFSGTPVLLVEDEEINREIARELLHDAGFTVEIAVNGAEAIEKFAGGEHALLLMDMQMPVIDGLEATRRIRADFPGRPTPIIAMTANAFREDRERCLDSGMNDFLVKPVDPDALFAMLLKWLEQPRPQAT